MSFAELKAALRIEQVVTRYVSLRQKGQHLFGKCPFHEDHGRPNLVVFTGTQTYKCFACGAQGDVIDFVARIEHLGQGEAARRLEKETGPLAGQGKRTPTPAQPPATVLADVERRDRVYRATLALFPLTEPHRENLRKRGLNNTVIDKVGYGSLHWGGRMWVASQLLFREHRLDGVPGFGHGIKDHSWRLFGPPGILIPVIDLEGRIVAMQVRTDDTEQPPSGRQVLHTHNRYRWISSPDSSRCIGGASSGAPCHVAGRHHLSREYHALWITEGPLKADVASHLLNTPFLGVAGVSNWRKALPILEAIRPTTVILAFDRDPDPNTRRAVERETREARKAIAALGCEVSVAAWREGKGIDDALNAGAEIRFY